MSVRWAGANGLQSTTLGMEWQSSAALPTVETTIVRDSGAAWRYTGTNKACTQIGYYTAQGVHYYRIYIHLVTAPGANGSTFLSIDNGATQKIVLRMNTNRTIEFFNNEDTTQISVSPAINTGEFYRIELKIDDTTLASTAVEAKLYAAADEATSLWNPTATVNMAAALNRFSVRCINATMDFVFTDIVIVEVDGNNWDTWAGEGSLGYLRPDGNSGTPQWARGGTDSGANWSQNDETPPNDITDYVQSNTNNQVDDYTLLPTPGSVASDDVINWVAVGVRFRITSQTGADPDFVLRLTAGGNTDESGNVSGAGNTAWASYQTTPVLVFPMVRVDLPGASTAAWTKSDLDSAIVGIRESVTDTHFAQVSAMWLIFDHKPAPAAPGGGSPHYYAMITESQAGA